MSATLGYVSGKIEIPIREEMKSKYEDIEMSVNSFWGGFERGRCSQLTIQSGASFIQLTEKDVDDLIKLLNRWKNQDY